MANEFDKKAERTNKHLRMSVQSARSLGFELAGVDTKMAGAATAAASFAENIAKASRNARVAASATGIGLIVAALGTAVAFGIGLRDRMKEVAKATAEVGRETAILNAQARGDEREERELRIAQAMEEELDAAKRLKSRFVDLSGLQSAIRAKANAARVAAATAAAREMAARRADFTAERFDYVTETGLMFRSLEGEAKLARARVEANHRRDLMALDRERSKDQNDKTRLSDDELALRAQDIQDRYRAELKVVEHELQAPARALGASVAGAIADGISQGVQMRDFWKGLQAVTGGIIMAIGEMMQEVGTKALLASSLIAKVMALIGTPAGIPAALALIAAGAVVKGIGATIAGTGTAWDPQRGVSSSGGGYSTGRTTYVGVVSPAMGPSTANLKAAQPVVVQATIIGRNDPDAQRDILDLIKNGQMRAAGAA